MRIVRSFVPSKSNVAIDARKILVRAASDQYARIELKHVRREAFEQLSEWLDHRLAISLAIRVHPRLVVVPLEFAKEFERFCCQDA
jgi:hypothetical protein